MDDVPALDRLIRLSIDALQRTTLSAEDVVASHEVMGLDTQLIRDGTYLLVEDRGRIVGCGGWSRRATLFGGEHAVALRDARLLQPAREPARIRAMYTHPAFARQGIARSILSVCERRAAAEGFRAVELMATLTGEPLYLAAGYAPLEAIRVPAGGRSIPFIRMGKRIDH